jgi:hypothetical protein
MDQNKVYPQYTTEKSLNLNINDDRTVKSVQCVRGGGTGSRGRGRKKITMRVYS